MARPQRGVFERPPGSGIWWISYYGPDGKRHREKVGRQDVALDAYFKRRLEIHEGRFRAPRVAGISFKDLVAEAFADRRVRLAPRSFLGNQQDVQRWLAWFGPAPAARITAAMIADRLREIRDSGVSGSTANRHKALLSAIFTWGVRAGKLAANPARGIPSYRECEARVRFLDAGEEQALRAAVRREWPECEAQLDLALHTGMRRNELYRLTWDQVDLERGILTVRGKAHANSPKGARRFLRLNSIASRALVELHERSEGSPYVCPGRHHQAPDFDRDRHSWFELSVKAAKIDNFRFHDLRHTFASRLVMAGVPLAAVMEMLGHRSIAMTMRYAHLAPDHQRANVEKLVTDYPAPAALRQLAPEVAPVRMSKARIRVSH